MSEKDKETIANVFPKAKNLKKKYNAIDNTSAVLPIPDGRKNRDLKKNPKTTSKQGEAKTEKVPKEVYDIMDKNKDELWDIILNEDINVEDFDKKLNNLVRKMPKTSSALKGVRELYEDKLQINELREIISDSRSKKSGNTNKTSVEDEAEETSDLMSMIPLLKKLRGQGEGQGNKLGMEDLMWLMASKPNKQSSNMLPIIMMMMQNQNQNQGTNNNTQQPNAEFNKMLLDEVKNIIGQQQQQQPSAIDPNTMLLLKFMDNQKQNNQPSNIDRLIEKLISDKQNTQQPGIEVVLDKFNTMISNNQSQQFQLIMQQSQDRFDRSMEMIAGAMQGKNPKKELLEDFNIFKSIQGENRNRSKDEMDYDFKYKQLNLEERKRADALNREDRRRMEMLAREERKDAREAAKSDKIMDLATDFIAPIMQDGLGGVINDVMSASKAKGRKRKPRTNPSEDEQEFSASDIDNL